jgi:acetyltransferase EpsM
MEIKKVIIIGTNGNANAIAASMIEAYTKGALKSNFIGFIGDRHSPDNRIIGSIYDIPSLIKNDYYFIFSTNIKNTLKIEEQIIQKEKLNIPEERLVTFIHPLAYVAPTALLGSGCVIMPYAIVQPGTTMGKCCTIMHGAIMGHDNSIGNHCFFDSGSISGAYLKMGDGVYVGLNSTIREYLTIERYSHIGLGSILLKNVGENETWIGNPAKLGQ